jgi:putative zinc finger protein
MPHLDEGTLHALLDGELEGTEVMEIQAHLGSCASCGSRLKDIREFMGEADRLLASVDLPSSASRPAPAAAPVVPAPVPESPRPVREAPARALAPRRPLASADRPAPWEEPPVLLIPDNPDQIELKRRWLHGMGWAATVAVAVGLGFMVSQARKGVAPVPAGPAVDSRQSPAPSNAVVSTEETPRPDSAASQSASPPRDSAGPEAVPRAARVAAERAVSKPAKRAENKPAEKQALAAKDEVTPDSQPAESLASGDTAAAGREDPAVIRARAAQALADLDRERIRSRAAAATAALDAQGRARAAQEPAPAAPPPPPPTLEQRSRIYLRIGLDEASRQLGGPAHVIEGLNPSFMGLAQGGLSPGADTTRPVVRVVYQDSQGRMILLDQQRVRPGQATPARRSNTPIWTVDDVVLHLQGEVGPDILRNLQPRVR